MSDVTQDDKYTACHQITKQDNDDQRNKDCITTEFCAVGQFWISKCQGWALGAATKYHPAPKAQQGNSCNWTQNLSPWRHALVHDDERKLEDHDIDYNV